MTNKKSSYKSYFKICHGRIIRKLTTNAKVQSKAKQKQSKAKQNMRAGIMPRCPSNNNNKAIRAVRDSSVLDSHCQFRLDRIYNHIPYLDSSRTYPADS